MRPDARFGRGFEVKTQAPLLSLTIRAGLKTRLSAGCGARCVGCSWERALRELCASLPKKALRHEPYQASNEGLTLSWANWQYASLVCGTNQPPAPTDPHQRRHRSSRSRRTSRNKMNRQGWTRAQPTRERLRHPRPRPTRRTRSRRCRRTSRPSRSPRPTRGPATPRRSPSSSSGSTRRAYASTATSAPTARAAASSRTTSPN